jgi:hypothetical protein
MPGRTLCLQLVRGRVIVSVMLIETRKEGKMTYYW